MSIKILQNKYNHLTREERSALYHLKNDKNIVIKRADKDSAVVVLVGMIILKRLTSNWEIKIFMRRCVMIPDLFSAPCRRKLKKFVNEAI